VKNRRFLATATASAANCRGKKIPRAFLPSAVAAATTFVAAMLHQYLLTPDTRKKKKTKNKNN